LGGKENAGVLVKEQNTHFPFAPLPGFEDQRLMAAVNPIEIAKAQG